MEHNEIPLATPAPPEPPAPAAGASARATVTLVLGVFSILCTGFLTGIPAIIVGQMELKAIKAGQAPTAGENIARVGFILGIVGTVLTCLAITGFILLMMLGISLSSSELVKQAAFSI